MKRTRLRASKRTKASSDESNKVTVEQNKLTDEKERVTDESNKVCNETTINLLNDDCLVNIFTFLPVVDRIRIQRVCKRWQNISTIPWSDKKRLVFFDETWSSNLPKDLYDRLKHELFENKNNLPKIKIVLKLCGQYITHVRFYLFEGTTEIFKEIKKRCPNLKSLDNSESIITHVSRMKYLANNFHFLHQFQLGYCSSPTDVDLMNFFKNNTNLKSLRLYNSYVSGYCLSFLPETLEDFIFYQYDSKIYPDLIYHSLGRLPNLITLLLSCSYKESTLDVDKALKALPLNSSLKKIILINNWNEMTPLKSEYWANLKNLEYLRLKGPWIWNIEEQEIINNSCLKLSQIHMDGIIMSTLALASILTMPKLRILILSNIDSLKDKHFYEKTEVEELGINFCDNITKLGLVMLSKNAKNLKKLQIRIDESIHEPIKINNIKNIFKKKNIKIYINGKSTY